MATEPAAARSRRVNAGYVEVAVTQAPHKSLKKREHIDESTQDTESSFGDGADEGSPMKKARQQAKKPLGAPFKPTSSTSKVQPAQSISGPTRKHNPTQEPGGSTVPQNSSKDTKIQGQYATIVFDVLKRLRKDKSASRVSVSVSQCTKTTLMDCRTLWCSSGGSCSRRSTHCRRRTPCETHFAAHPLHGRSS